MYMYLNIFYICIEIHIYINIFYMCVAFQFFKCFSYYMARTQGEQEIKIMSFDVILTE